MKDADRRSDAPEETTPLLRHRDESSDRLSVHQDSHGEHRTGIERTASNGSKGHSAIPPTNGQFLAPGVEVDATSAADSEAGEDGRKNAWLLVDVSTTRFWMIFGGVLVAYFVATFDSTLMASSHPVITSYFNASNSASWLSTAFLLTSTAFQPLFGRLSDTVGRRPLYMFSLTMFAATTAWCGLAQSIGSFIAARAFCGLGAGGVFAMGSIMTNDLVSIEVRGTYQAYINLFYGLGSACGAAFGGFLCDTIGWRWTFGVQIPPILVILVAAAITTPTSLGPHLAKNTDASVWTIIKGFDLLGSLLLSLSVGFLILGMNLGGNVFPWKHPLVITSLVLAFVAGSILMRVESRHARPVMPTKLLWTAPRGNLVFNNFFSNVGINTIIFNAPLYFQAVQLDTPSQSGFRLAIPSLAITFFGVSTGLFISWTGRMKGPLVIGAVFLVIGSVCLTSMWDGIPSWLATLFVVPSAIGQGIAFPAASIAVLATSSQEDQAVMTSTLSLWRSLGTVMGVAISSLVLQNALSAYLDQLVTGKHKEDIIDMVRKSVRSIVDLDPKHQAQVMRAYELSLRMTFLSSIVMFVIVTILIVPAKIPRIGRR